MRISSGNPDWPISLGASQKSQQRVRMSAIACSPLRFHPDFSCRQFRHRPNVEFGCTGIPCRSVFLPTYETEQRIETLLSDSSTSPLVVAATSRPLPGQDGAELPHWVILTRANLRATNSRISPLLGTAFGCRRTNWPSLFGGQSSAWYGRRHD